MLPLDHPFRNDPSFGPPELKSPPRPRTHDEALQFGAAVKKQRVQGIREGTVTDVSQLTGVTGLSLLAELPGYDLVRAASPDPMHVIKGSFTIICHLS